MKKILSALLFTTIGLISKTTYAATEAECSVWLCLPMGFAPSQCKDARKAFIKRITKLKFPLVSLNSCGGSAAVEQLNRSTDLPEGIDNITVKHERVTFKGNSPPSASAVRPNCGDRNDDADCHTGGYVEVYVDGVMQGERVYYHTRMKAEDLYRQ